VPINTQHFAATGSRHEVNIMGRRQERREERRSGSSESAMKRYQMRQKMVSIGDDYFIEDDRGQRVFKVDGKALRLRQTLKFEDMQGQELCQIQEKVARIKDSMEIEGANGDRMAMIKKAMITPVRERWTVKIGDGPDLDIQGNILDHEYRIDQGRDKVAEISKKWFRVRDTYGVEIEPGQNDVVILAATVAVDMMADPGR
jgi:uncharacterized protein YxjI